ncbi:glycosyltransferase family 4 protein [bacterium]|nr:glycosyltransferase family 4 protein [bacterium]
MNKKVAIITKYFIEITSESDGVRGAGLYICSFIYSLSLCCDVDVYCEENTPVREGSNIKNIFHYEKGNPPSAEDLEKGGYDFVWSLTDKVYKSDKFLTFTLQHSHSRLYRQKYIRRPYELFIKRIFNPSRYYTKSKIKEYKKVFKTTDILFANSKIAYNDYINLCELPPEEIPLLNPMIPKAKSIKKEKHDLFTFGMSAVTFDLKGGYIFLEALYNLKKTTKNFRAKVIYPHFKKNFILRFFYALWGLKKYVEVLDFQKSMDNFYNSVDCIVMPSREETFGFVAAEGMAHKLPVIVSSASGICDIIENEKNGFIFDIRKHPV